jgi:hypothetical protein
VGKDFITLTRQKAGQESADQLQPLAGFTADTNGQLHLKLRWFWLDLRQLSNSKRKKGLTPESQLFNRSGEAGGSIVGSSVHRK